MDSRFRVWCVDSHTWLLQYHSDFWSQTLPQSRAAHDRFMTDAHTRFMTDAHTRYAGNFKSTFTPLDTVTTSLLLRLVL